MGVRASIFMAQDSGFSRAPSEKGSDPVRSWCGCYGLRRSFAALTGLPGLEKAITDLAIKLRSSYKEGMRYPRDHKENTRRRILDAAAAVFRKRGYQAAGVDAVMHEAG